MKLYQHPFSTSAFKVRAVIHEDLDSFPNVKAWVARLEARESVRKSLPPI